jgi:hypothetical protein
MRAEPRSDQRIGAVIETVWWLGAGWEAAGKPSKDEGDAVLQGMWWIRNRSFHDIGMLVRGFGGYADGYGGSPPPVTKTADVYTDLYEDVYGLTEIWGSLEEIRPTLSMPDETGAEALRAYNSYLAGKPVYDTIMSAVAHLRGIGEALE